MRIKFGSSWAWLIMLSLLTLSACGGQSGNKAVPTLSETAKLSELQGAVGVKNLGESEFSNAVDGELLQVQGQVQTGSDGRARLDLSTGTVVRVAPDSLFTLVSSFPQGGSLLTRISLLAGKVWITLVGGQLQVDTPSGVASVRGSNLTVWIDPQTNDIWVSCVEGWCQAGNETASLDLLSAEGTVLYYFDPTSNVPPPPPLLRYLSPQDINDFLINNPEAQSVVNSIIATASSLPSLTPAPTNTPTLTSTPTVTDTSTPTDTPTPTLTPTLMPLPTDTPTETDIPQKKATPQQG